MPDPVDPRPLDAASVQPGDPWLPVEVRDEVGSTNAELVGDPRPWRVLVAERQTAGRGRLARTWVTTPGASLAVSVVVPADGMPLGWVPLAAGLALAEAIESAAGVRAGLKWPNDLLLPDDGGRKVAGILCEWTAAGVVIGTGVNVSQSREQLPLATATSVRVAGGEVSREVLLAAYLTRLAGLAGALRARPEEVRQRYLAGRPTVGERVRVETPAGTLTGTAADVDAEGRLVLRTPEGSRPVSAGDVVHLRSDA